MIQDERWGLGKVLLKIFWKIERKKTDFPASFAVPTASIYAVLQSTAPQNKKKKKYRKHDSQSRIRRLQSTFNLFFTAAGWLPNFIGMIPMNIL